MISTPPWMKEMERLSQTIKSYYSDLLLPQEAFSKTMNAVSLTMPTVEMKGLTEAFQPIYWNKTAHKAIDICSITTHMAESLTAFSATVTAIVDSQQSIERLASGLRKSIPNLLAGYELESILKRINEQSFTFSDHSTDIPDSFEWDAIKFGDDKIEYQGVIVTRDDVSELMNPDECPRHSEDEQRKKLSVIKAIVCIIITLMALLDIPGNWTIQEIAHLTAEYTTSQNHRYYIFEDYANVYLDPDRTSEIIECLSYGTIVKAVEEDEFWVKINLKSPSQEKTNGWIQKTKIKKYFSDDD